QAPILTVQIGMGENILILAFVITVIGGIGSIRGAFVAAILVGFIDTLGRAYFTDLLRLAFTKETAATAAPALSSLLIYLLMGIVLGIKPQGLFSASGQGEHGCPPAMSRRRYCCSHCCCCRSMSN